jgi:hypothetical protein
MENTKRWHHHDGIFWGNHLFELLEFFEQFRNNQINHHKTPKKFSLKNLEVWKKVSIFAASE